MTDAEATPPRRSRRLVAIAVLAAGALAVVAMVVFAVTRDGSMGSAASMSDRAAQVMPFDLAHAHHTFTKTDTGSSDGDHRVVARPSGSLRES